MFFGRANSAMVTNPLDGPTGMSAKDRPRRYMTGALVANVLTDLCAASDHIKDETQLARLLGVDIPIATRLFA